MAPVVYISLIWLALFLFVVFAGRDQRAFRKRFPPISDSDKEFVARCRPGTTPDVALRVRRIVSRHYGIPSEQVHPSSRFMEDFGAG